MSIHSVHPRWFRNEFDVDFVSILKGVRECVTAKGFQNGIVSGGIDFAESNSHWVDTLERRSYFCNCSSVDTRFGSLIQVIRTVIYEDRPCAIGGTKMEVCAERIRLAHEIELAAIASDMAHSKFDSDGISTEQIQLLSGLSELADRLLKNARDAYDEHINSHHCIESDET